MTTDCYCRGGGHCTDCAGHVCTRQCQCDVDGAPQDILPSQTFPKPSGERA